MDTRQRFNSQLEKQEREISQLQKRLEQEVEQRHLLTRNQEVSIILKCIDHFEGFCFVCFTLNLVLW